MVIRASNAPVCVEMANKYVVAGIVIILAAVIGLALITSVKPGPSSSVSQNVTTVSSVSGSSSGSVVLALTDPPEVPPGTNSLILSYTGIMLHETSSSNVTGFVDVNTSGSVNLLSLTNVSQIVAIAKVPANVLFNSIVFTGATANITINGSTYNVTIPSSRLQVKVFGNLSDNVTALIDLTPSVVQIYGGANASQNVFVMVPFSKAIVVGSTSANANAVVGSRDQINANERAKLEQNSSNVGISSTSLAEQSNSMIVSVTVKNYGNSSVTLRHLFIRGLLVTSFNGNVGAGSEANTSLRVNIGAYPRYNYNTTGVISVNASINGKEGSDNSGNAIHDNQSGNYTTGATVRDNANASIESTIKNDLHDKGNLSAAVSAYINGSLEFKHDMHSSLNFIISSNGTLLLPQTESEAEGQSGYVLAPGKSITLSYDGEAMFGESGMAAQFISNQTYSIIVQGEESAYATVNATAT